MLLTSISDLRALAAGLPAGGGLRLFLFLDDNSPEGEPLPAPVGVGAGAELVVLAILSWSASCYKPVELVKGKGTHVPISNFKRDKSLLSLSRYIQCQLISK